MKTLIKIHEEANEVLYSIDLNEEEVGNLPTMVADLIKITLEAFNAELGATDPNANKHTQHLVITEVLHLLDIKPEDLTKDERLLDRRRELESCTQS